jgi:hypothetical protein
MPSWNYVCPCADCVVRRLVATANDMPLAATGISMTGPTPPWWPLVDDGTAVVEDDAVHDEPAPDPVIDPERRLTLVEMWIRDCGRVPLGGSR